MSGTHEPDPRDRVPVSGGPCAAGRAGTTEASLRRNAGGSRTHYQPLCRRPPHRVAPALDELKEFQKCPRQDSDLVLDLRRVACDPPHSEDVYKSLLSGTPPRIRTSSGSFEGCRASTTLAGHFTKLALKENETPDGSSAAADRLAGRFHVSTWIRTRTRTFGGSDALRYTIETNFTCSPFAHHQRGPTAGFAPASSCLQDRRLS
jgi:hypothetical protein